MSKKGVPKTEKWKKEQSLRAKAQGFGQWGKGKKRPPFSEEWKKKIGDAQRGRVLSEEVRKNHSIGAKKAGCGKWMTGKHPSIETLKKLSEMRKGNKSHFWKGGIYPINKKLRASLEYRLWRKSVFERDNHTCIWCGSIKRLEADHIKRWSEFPELRFAIDNGRTLCHDCHTKTDNYANKRIR